MVREKLRLYNGLNTACTEIFIRTLKTVLMPIFVSIGPISAAYSADNSPELNNTCSQILFNKSEKDILLDQAHTYVESLGSSGRLLSLSKQEYRDKTIKEEVPSDVILVLEDIDLEVDLPFVAGVILSKPLTALGTHIQVLCEKMGIPLVHIPNAYAHPDLRRASENSVGYYSLKTSSNSTKLSWSEKPILISRPQRALPASKPFSIETTVIETLRSEINRPREVVGDKFFPLHRLSKNGHARDIPNMVSVTTDFYETMMDRLSYSDESLSRIVLDAQRKLEYLTDFNQIKNLLRDIRLKIENAQMNENDLEFVSEVLNQIRTNLNIFEETPLSIRSNNDVEDLIAAGLYKSVKTKDASPEEFIEAIKEVYSSLFTLRAFQIRRAWGLKESNLRMPLLVHPYISNEHYNATAKFFVHPRNGNIYAEVNVVLGAETNATNPREGSESFNVLYESSSRGHFSPISTSETSSHRNLKFSIGHFLSSYMEPVEGHLFRMAINAQHIDIEFLGKRIEDSEYFRHQLLQYKHSYTSDVVAEVLNGGIRRSDLDTRMTATSLSDDIDTVASNLGATPLHKAGLRHFNSNARFVLIYINNKYEVLIWHHSFHLDFKEKLENFYPHATWIRSGYLKMDPDGAFNFYQRSLIMFDGVDFSTLIPRYSQLFPRRAFLKAFKNAVNRGHEFSEATNTFDEISVNLKGSRRLGFSVGGLRDN